MENKHVHMCEMCGKRPANVFIKKNINGNVIEKELCSECAAQLENGDWLENFFPTDLFSSIMSSMPFESGIRAIEKKCPVCGTTERQIRDNYEFGCSECYKVFSDLAKAYVRQLGGKAHRGRTPLSAGTQVNTESKTENVQEKKQLSIEEQIAALEREKAKAVDDEDYDKAQELKLAIEALRNKTE